jgi:hypothetical protein
MKRLFKVNGEFYASKAAAKAARGERVNGPDGAPVYKYTVQTGPDHWKNL